MNNTSDKTTTLVKKWIWAKSAAARAAAAHNAAQTELLNATQDLGKWLLPEDAKYGEQFNIWYGSGILRAELTDAMSRDVKVDWRKEPDDKQKGEQGY